jgi:pyruvate/2-oxoacid:ferredoxin oxidoreductase beta subunit
VARLAVLTRIFPLYEVEGGERLTINVKPEFRPVRDYLKMQGRFNHLTDQNIEAIQQNVEKAWNKLVKRAES